MKKQTKSAWQTVVFNTIAVIVLLLAANSLAFAQTTYKVGDRAETMSAGDWVEVEIIEVKDNGDYMIRYVKSGISGAWAQEKHLRPIKANSTNNNQNNVNNQVQNQTNGNKPAENQTTDQTTKTNRFGARDPRTCKDTKAPTKGAITAALALKYINCQAEGISSNLLYLVENVKVEVGGGVPYDPTLGAFESINVRVPLYPIRGSLLKYQCKDLVTEHIGPPDTNCNTYNNLKATGYCYKTTFGDWKCAMADRSSNEKENFRKNVAPPKP